MWFGLILLLLFICTIVFLVFGIAFESMSGGEWVLKTILILLSIISIFTFIKTIVYKPETELELSNSYNIYALEDNFAIKGSRYYIEEDAQYYYLADYKDGKKMYSVSKSKSYIVEKENELPRIEVYRQIITGGKFIKKIYSPLYEYNKEYKFIVPKETLTTEFNIDMKK